MRFLSIITLTCFSLTLMAQKSKVNAAWRALNDYEETSLTEKPDLSYLVKARTSIDTALNNKETKVQSRTFAYKSRIMYDFYQYNLKQEQKKLEPTVQDKNERVEMAYGATSLVELEQAASSLDSIKKYDPKYFAGILDIINKGNSVAEDDDVKLAQIVGNMKIELVNIAQIKFKMKEYDAAADVFFKSAELSGTITGQNDTSLYYNACVAAQKSKNIAKVIKYNRVMIDKNIATTFNYKSVYDAEMAQKNNEAASEILKLGRQKFPNDAYLMNLEAENFMQQGNKEKAVLSLEEAASKDPKNSFIQLSLGDLYSNLANPKTIDGKDTVKPQNFEDLTLKAADHYQKAIDLKPADSENYYIVLYNLGALYNNYGIALYNKSMEKATLTDLAKNQKQYEAKSMEYYKKAIPYLEQALTIKPNDVAALTALRKLYYLVGNEAKGKEMSDRLKK